VTATACMRQSGQTGKKSDGWRKLINLRLASTQNTNEKQVQAAR
jgi:hypothetical protein